MQKKKSLSLILYPNARAHVRTHSLSENILSGRVLYIFAFYLLCMLQ